VVGARQSPPVAQTPPEMALGRIPGTRTRSSSRKVNQQARNLGPVAPATQTAPRVMAKAARAGAVVHKAVVVAVGVESSLLLLTNALITRTQSPLQQARPRARVPLFPTSRRLLQTLGPCLTAATKHLRLVPPNQSHPRNQPLHQMPLPSIRLPSSLPLLKCLQGTGKFSLPLNNRFRITPASDNIHQVLTR